MPPDSTKSFLFLYKDPDFTIFNKNNIQMKQLKIDIPEGYEIDKEKSTFENIVFKKINDKYPVSVTGLDRPCYINADSSIEEFTDLKYQTINHVSTRERAEAFLALIQLLELRDAWNKIDGFVVDWCNMRQVKYCIVIMKDEIMGKKCNSFHRPLYFGSKETMDKFLETFKGLIEQAKELL